METSQWRVGEAWDTRHHGTSNYEYIHKWMEPWVRYVPVKSDLSDLKQQFEWAGNHQDKAREISEAATNLARRLGTKEGFDALFHEMFEVLFNRLSMPTNQ
eukprot:877932_1